MTDLEDGTTRKRPPRRKAVLIGMTAAIAVITTFALAEIGLRIYYGKIERITGVAEWAPATWDGLTYHWDRYHPRFGWTNLPEYKSDDSIPFGVTINKRGLRGSKEYADVAPEGVRRIVVLGDSCTFGEEVDDHETVPAYLEQALQNVEALNFGVHGYGLGQMALRLEGEAMSLRPDRVVVVILLTADLMRVTKDHFSHNKPVFSMAGTELVIGNVPVPEASRLPWHVRNSFTAAWLLGRSQATTTPNTETVGDVLNITSALLRRMNAACEKGGAKLTVVTMVVHATLTKMRKDEKLREVIAHIGRTISELGFDHLHLVRDLQRVYAVEGRRLAAPHGHWTAPANCFIASRIADHLASRGDRFERKSPQVDCLSIGK